MANERITEDIVRDWLKLDPQYETLKVEEQKSESLKIQKLLKNASKSGNGLGKPEFLVSGFVKPYDNLLIVIECKAETKYHESKTGDQYSQYAVDGVKLYASYLSKVYDVIAVAVSGEDKKDLKISYSYWKNGYEDNILSFQEDHFYKLDDIVELYKPTIIKQIAREDLKKFANDLNDSLQKYNVAEDKRAFLVSGILLALDDQGFLNSYQSYKEDPESLSELLVTNIISKLKKQNVASIKTETLTEQYNFIKIHHDLVNYIENLDLSKDPLTKWVKKEDYSGVQYLEFIITAINTNVSIYLKEFKNRNSIDAIGEMYTEFLRYANNEAKLGIVLTPPHITEFMCELIDINARSKDIDKIDTIIDTCCGTGGFLIAGMSKMINDVNGDTNLMKEIKENRIIGIEKQSNIHALACANMVLHGDGKSHVIQADSFNSDLDKMVKRKKPNKALLNPPYKAKESPSKQLEFIERACDLLQANGLCCAIVQITCGTGKESRRIRNKILKKHTLEAVISMPNELFYPTAVVTCIMVFKAHNPHPDNKKTWFGYLKDDGFEKRKDLGRVNYRGKWDKIKKDFIDCYTNREVKSSLSVLHQVTGNDEWCAEAYMETDYTKLSQEDFENILKKYASFLVLNGDNNDPSSS